MFVRSSVFAAAALAAGLINIGLAAAPAFAQGQETIAVSYADLNLASVAGRDVLDRRVASAAYRLCGEARDVELGWAAAVQTCRADTIAMAQPQISAAVGLRGTVRVSQADPLVRVSRAAN